MDNTCIFCEKVLPEGMMVCADCEKALTEKNFESVIQCKNCNALFKATIVNKTVGVQYCPVCASKLDGRHTQVQYTTNSPEV